jgi:hypothetical protein
MILFTIIVRAGGLGQARRCQQITKHDDKNQKIFIVLYSTELSYAKHELPIFASYLQYRIVLSMVLYSRTVQCM